MSPVMNTMCLQKTHTKQIPFRNSDLIWPTGGRRLAIRGWLLSNCSFVTNVFGWIDGSCIVNTLRVIWHNWDQSGTPRGLFFELFSDQWFFYCSGSWTFYTSYHVTNQLVPPSWSTLISSFHVVKVNNSRFIQTNNVSIIYINNSQICPVPEQTSFSVTLKAGLKRISHFKQLQQKLGGPLSTSCSLGFFQWNMVSPSSGQQYNYTQNGTEGKTKSF